MRRLCDFYLTTYGDGLAALDGEYEFINPSGMRIVVQDGKIIGMRFIKKIIL